MYISYLILKCWCSYTTKIFFRDVNVINESNIPNQGATIIYGNHNNQFVDGVLLVATVQRQISFIAAAISCRRPLIGHLIRASGAIPVERPQDIAKKGEGTVVEVVKGKVLGQGTKFSTNAKVGCSINIQNHKTLQISAIVSDVEIETTSMDYNLNSGQYNYKIIPKLEFNNLYENVWLSLKQQKCIGIFPEGGSHDRLQMLPLKAGICIMALGAAAKYKIPIQMVPCGFNYYNPQNFRSKVVIEFGPAYTIPQELVQLYEEDRKKAISILLTNLEKVYHSRSQMLKSCITEFKSFQQLSTLFVCRQLYTMNSRRTLNIKEKLQLNRRFSKGFEHMLKKQQYKEQYTKLQNFTDFVKLNGLPINREHYFSNIITDVIRFVFYFEKCLFRLILALPGLLVMAPTTTLIAHLAERQRIKCLKKSSVKQSGNDVVGSYKILVSIILIPTTAVLHSTGLFLLLHKYFEVDKYKSLQASLGLFALLPVYAFLMVKSLDSFGQSWKKLKYFFIRIFKRSVYDNFHQNKIQLSKRITEMVNKYGDQVIEDFHEKRILNKQDIIMPQSHLYIFDEEDNNK